MKKKVRLKHSIIAYPPYRIEEKVTTPGAAIIEISNYISNYDHADTDSLVIWDGAVLVVDKELLATF